MKAIIISVVDTLLRIGFAVIGSHFSIRAGRSFSDFEDVKAAIFMGLGILFLAMAVRSL